MVPMAGLEPARVSPPPPQGGASTNFTTSACFFFNYYYCQPWLQSTGFFYYLLTHPCMSVHSAAVCTLSTNDHCSTTSACFVLFCFHGRSGILPSQLLYLFVGTPSGTLINACGALVIAYPKEHLHNIKPIACFTNNIAT